MLLNVVTTNPGEVSELLGNLSAAIITVVILYVPTIAYAIYLTIRKKQLASRPTRYRQVSLMGIACGSALLICSHACDKNYSINKDLFPVNVCDNVVIAIDRYIKTNNYPETSRGFSYNAKSTRPTGQKEIYIMVIGETARAGNWQMFGYKRPTNPELTKQEGIVGFSKVLTESNTTHKSVPMLMSSITAENFDSIYYRKSIITAFKEAGFHTSFFSSQQRNRSFIDYFSDEAHETEYLSDYTLQNLDEALIEKMNTTISRNRRDKQFIVLHTYGSHFNYSERYPETMSKFLPDNATDASPAHREELINAYDNTIIYTDHLLSTIINSLKQHTDADIAMLYVSDHGEDIFDDSRNRFLHASPTPTYYQLHVPMILWMSDSYREKYPSHWFAANINKNRNISSSASVFHTLLHIAGIESSFHNCHNTLTDANYTEPERIYVNDRNEALPIQDCGLKTTDKEILTAMKLIFPDAKEHTTVQLH